MLRKVGLVAGALAFLFGSTLPAMTQSSITTIYSWSATKVDGQIEMSGAVPAISVQKFLDVRAGGIAEDATRVKDGAPDSFVTHAVAAITALSRLDEGRVAFTGAKWSIAGSVSSEAERTAALAEVTALGDQADWIIFIDIKPSPVATSDTNTEAVEAEVSASEAEMEPAENATVDVSESVDAGSLSTAEADAGSAEAAQPEAEGPTEPAAPESENSDEAATESAVAESVEADAGSIFSWSATVADDGTIEFSGNVPHLATANYLSVKAGGADIGSLSVNNDAPENFGLTAVAALEAIKSLSDGRAAYTGAKWTIYGSVADDAERDAILTSLNSSVNTKDWLIFLNLPPFTFVAEYERGQSVTVAGMAPSEGFKSYLPVISEGLDASGLKLASNAPEGFVLAAAEGIRQLRNMERGTLYFDGSAWTLSGETINADVNRAIEAALSGQGTFTTNFAQASLFDLCAEAVTAFSDSHTILFAPASARIAEESRLELTGLAEELLKCPGTNLYVEGHTDADGPDDANLTLSVARAEAVVDELISLGVDYSRIYAIGYGETLPIASNDTREGKAKNRRIVFRLERD